MGNGLSPCLLHLHMAAPLPAAVRLVCWGGRTRLLTDDDVHTAGDVAPPGHVVCPSDSFFVGLPVPVMSAAEELLTGRTYLVLPAASFPCLTVLTAATLAALSTPHIRAHHHQCPFERVKTDGGAALVRVLPDFVEKVVSCGGVSADTAKASKEALCSTPELKRHYAQLVGPRNRPWSPRLDTIAESGNKLSLSRWTTTARLSSCLPVR